MGYFLGFRQGLTRDNYHLWEESDLGDNIMMLKSLCGLSSLPSGVKKIDEDIIPCWRCKLLQLSPKEQELCDLMKEIGYERSIQLANKAQGSQMSVLGPEEDITDALIKTMHKIGASTLKELDEKITEMMYEYHDSLRQKGQAFDNLTIGDEIDVFNPGEKEWEDAGEVLEIHLNYKDPYLVHSKNSGGVQELYVSDCDCGWLFRKRKL